MYRVPGAHVTLDRARPVSEARPVSASVLRFAYVACLGLSLGVWLAAPSPTSAAPDAGARDAAVRDAQVADAAPTDADIGDADAPRMEVEAGVEVAEELPAAPPPPPEPSGWDPAATARPERTNMPTTQIGEAIEDAIGVPARATDTVVRTLLGLVLLLAIAYLASHRKVQQLERVIGISQVVTAGFPFVALGLLARAPGIDLLTTDVVGDITPVLQFGLGWIGFLTGFQFDVRAIERMPRGTLQVLTLIAGAPFVVVSLAAAATLAVFGHADDPPRLLRNAALLGAAGALTSPTVARMVRVRGFSDDDVDLARSLGLLDDLAGIVGLMFLGAFVRSPMAESRWSLPGTGWLLLTVGLAVVLGVLVHVLLGYASRGADRAALLIGSVAFAAGIAGVLQLSPLVVCCLAGAILRNLRRPGDALGPVLERFERPIYLVFLAVAGALWRIDDYRGWVLVPIFVLARVVGRYLGVHAARRIALDTHDSELVRSADAGLLVTPMGSLSIALVVSAQTLYLSRYVHLFVTAVIGGSIVLEVLVQILSRTRPAGDEAPTEASS